MPSTPTTDELMGYEYHRHYSQDFLSPTRGGVALRDALENDFILNCSRFLKTHIHAAPEAASSIARSLYVIMSNGERHYHSPYWTMRTFHFISCHGIKLSAWEQLAIWFRAAIHSPAYPLGMSERQSVGFMRSVLPFGYRMNENEIINVSERAIMATADHFAKIDATYDNIVDLDLSIFASKYNIFEQAMLCLRTEYMSEMNPQQFRNLQQQLFKKILDRRHIYRSQLFQQKFDEQARTTLTSWLNRT